MPGGVMKQQTFASVAWQRKGKVTRRERFLAEMDAVIPWRRLIELIEPYYHDPEGRAASLPDSSGCCGSTFLINGFAAPCRKRRSRSTSARRSRRLAGG